jgi:ATP-dependent Clp protease ATP-binding subunit ClpC
METMNDAIDKSDEQVNLINIKKTQNILDLEQKIEVIRLQKEEFVRNHQFEKAARSRDTQKYLLEELDLAKSNMKDQNELN